MPMTTLNEFNLTPSKDTNRIASAGGSSYNIHHEQPSELDYPAKSKSSLAEKVSANAAKNRKSLQSSLRGSILPQSKDVSKIGSKETSKVVSRDTSQIKPPKSSGKKDLKVVEDKKAKDASPKPKVKKKVQVLSSNKNSLISSKDVSRVSSKLDLK